MANVEKMLFENMKLQLLSLFVSTNHEKNITPSYAFAWSAGIYPALDEGAHWHEEFTGFFRVSGDQLLKLLEFLDDCWDNKKKMSFYDLEHHYDIHGSGRDGPLWSRHSLIAACRYLFLNDHFDTTFWESLLENGQCPVEAKIICRDFSPADVYFC